MPIVVPRRNQLEHGLSEFGIERHEHSFVSSRIQVEWNQVIIRISGDLRRDDFST
jgi:hypothetical protein